MTSTLSKTPPPTRDAERTRSAILAAATDEFAAHGFGGARVDRIAERANANKRMLYHYFGNKEDLYLAVLEATYAGIRDAEKALDLKHLPPDEAMRRLVLFTFDYFQEHPEFLSLLNTENMLEARHLKRSRKIRALHMPLHETLSDVLERGRTTGTFRSDANPVQLYITIAALGFFYLSNRHTLSTIFAEELAEPSALEKRGDHMVSVVLGYLKSRN